MEDIVPPRRTEGCPTRVSFIRLICDRLSVARVGKAVAVLAVIAVLLVTVGGLVYGVIEDPAVVGPLAAAAATEGGIQQPQRAPATAPPSASPFGAGTLSAAASGLSVIDKLNTSFPGFLPSFLHGETPRSAGSILQGPIYEPHSSRPVPRHKGVERLAPNVEHRHSGDLYCLGRAP